MLLVLSSVAVTVGCQRDTSTAEGDAVSAKLAEFEKVNKAREELLAEVMDNAKLIQAIDEEVSRVRRLPRGVRVVAVRPNESPIATAVYRDSVMAHIRELTARLDTSEARLAKLGADSAAGLSSLRTRLEEYRATLAQTRASLAASQAELVSLERENRGLRTANAGLAREKTQLAVEKTAIEERFTEVLDETNTVYFIAGTKDELLERNILRETGGARNILLRKRGQTLVPAATLNADDFEALSKTGNREFRLPGSSKYAVVSPHDVSLLSPVDKDGVVQGTVKILDPARFWAVSKFLILVRR
jgi:chromosome segregation ATPase